MFGVPWVGPKMFRRGFSVLATAHGLRMRIGALGQETMVQLRRQMSEVETRNQEAR